MITIKPMKTIKFLLIIAILVPLVSSCSMKNADGSDTVQPVVEKNARPVRIMDLIYRETAVREVLTATIEPFEETYLSPALQGRIRSVKVDVNDHVQKGQILVEMDRTQLEQTRLQYETLKTDLARMDTLLRHGSVTRQSYDQMKSQVDITGLIMENLEENTVLRAPYSGIITGKYYDDGELFSPTPNTPAGKAALVSLIQIDPLKVLVNLSEIYLPQVKVGIDARITTDVYPGQVFRGKVNRIHPTVNAATRTFTVEVKMPNQDEKLRPGMFARVDLKLGEKQALIVPAVSVLQQAGTNERYIMLHDNGAARRVSVRILNRYDDQLEIASPELKGTESLIFAGHTNLENGAPVQVVVE
jgi:membrane fusion protein, multidrug efflux system